MRFADTTSSALQDAMNKIQSGIYSDLLIRCDGVEYPVHKAVVCPRSPFFEAAIRNNFIEGQSNTINLPDDEPKVVDAMIHYIYHGYYPRMDPKVEGMSKRKLHDGGWDSNTYGEFTGGLSVEFLNLHAKVYALAEKYGIPDLKAMAQRNFRLISNCGGCPSEEFAEAVKIIYGTVIDADRGLRDVVVEILHENTQAMEKDYILELMLEITELPYDLVLYRCKVEKKRRQKSAERPMQTRDRVLQPISGGIDNHPSFIEHYLGPDFEYEQPFWPGTVQRQPRRPRREPSWHMEQE